MNNKTKLTGLWKHEDKAGNTYFSGSLSPTARFVIFPNGYKSKDTDPDYYAYLVPAEPLAQVKEEVAALPVKRVSVPLKEKLAKN